MLCSLVLGLVAPVGPVRAASAYALEESGPTETAAVETYDLCAAYDADATRDRIGLVFEARDGGEALACLLTRQRAQVLRLERGKARVLASGPGVDVQEALELVVRRRAGSVRVFRGPTLLVEAYCRGFTAGRCGSLQGCGAPSDLLLQELAPIEFADDFFVGEERGADLWQMLCGALKVDVYWDPKQKLDDRPVGACWFANDGPGEHLATAGERFWDDYACEVSARPEEGSTVGLAFRVHDASNYGAVTLTLAAGGSVAELVEVRAGQRVSLGRLAGDWRPGHWCRLRAEVVGNEVRAFVGGVPLEPARFGGWPSGQVGLYAKTAGDCRFDDLWVGSLRRVEAAAVPAPAGPWHFASGAWAAGRGRVTCRAASTAVAVASVGAWTDCDLSAEVRVPMRGEAGLVARWSRQGGYAFLSQRKGADLLCRLASMAADCSLETLAEAKIPVPMGADAVAVGLTVAGSALRGSVNGACVARAWDGRLPSGEVGVVANAGQASFARFAATDRVGEERVSVLTEDGTGRTRPGAEHGAFDRFIGDLWKPLRGNCTTTTLGDEPAIRLEQGLLRYYMPRFGDVALGADVLQTGGQPLVLGICTDDRGQGGYTLALVGGALELSRQGQAVTSRPLAGGGEGLHWELRRDGPFIVGQAGEALVSYRDPEPLGNGSAIVRADGSAVLDNLDLGAEHALAYRFDRVEPDWTEVSGEWMLHSGMACIPWAYWLSGDGREGPAVLWHRLPSPPDVALHFDVSEYTEGYANGDHLHFPYHDISVVLAGDGANPDSGYRFLIGADGGVRTRLLRQGQAVAATDDRRGGVAMGSHSNTPRAAEVMVVKHGGDVRLIVNGVEALAYTDPQPLGGGQVALGVDKCRANFRDLFLYRDHTWDLPLGAAAFCAELPQ